MSEDISRDLGRIEGKLDAFMSRLQDHHDRMNRMDENHEQLVEKVEENTKKMYVVTTIASAVCGGIVSLVVKLLG